MPRPYRQFESGTTAQFTWTASTAPSSLSLAILTASGTVVDSGPAVQSGGGNWYRFVTFSGGLFPSYPRVLSYEWTATASTHTNSQAQFVNRDLFRLVKTQAFGS